jgi:predicted metal-dependent hydrolase
LALQVTLDGQVIVRAPKGVSKKVIDDFISGHVEWIIKKRDRARALQKANPPKTFTDGETYYYLGRIYKLFMVNQATPGLYFDNGFYLAKSSGENARSLLIKWYTQQAKKIISERAEYYKTITGLAFNRISITNAESRWGSCGANNNIRFSWRLVMAPFDVIDYVVVHELVHIQVKNHSKEFWGKLEKIYPIYRKSRLWLKENGRYLEI